MRRNLLLTVWGALCVAGLTLSCGGTKRPPVVTAAGARGVTRAPATTTSTAPHAPAQPVEEGTDFVPAREDDLSGMDLSGGGSPEGGPLADIHFDFDRASLTTEATAILDKHAAWLQAHAAVSVTIEGHCDERGTVEYNLALGEQRARSTLDYLRDRGVAADRMRVVSYGKERPVDSGHSEEAWAKNRRAHFAVGR